MDDKMRAYMPWRNQYLPAKPPIVQQPQSQNLKKHQAQTAEDEPEPKPDADVPYDVPASLPSPAVLIPSFLSPTCFTTRLRPRSRSCSTRVLAFALPFAFLLSVGGEAGLAPPLMSISAASATVTSAPASTKIVLGNVATVAEYTVPKSRGPRII